jgi:peptidoglycan hydrolase-like protein with peptidoglycan-binding domain
MSGSPRDLATPEPWRTSLERSRARRKPASDRRAGGSTTPVAAPRGESSLRLASLIDARRRLPSPRDLADSETWELSLVRSRTRRRAADLRFVPTTTRARRVSLGTLIAIAAGPAAGLADTSGASHVASAAQPEPATTTEHVVTLESGAEGRQVRLLQQALGVQVDGVFGPETEAAVRAFQQSHGLTVDGTVGAQTSAALAGRTPIASASATIASMISGGHRSDAVYTTPAPEGAGAGTPSSNPVVRLQEALGVQVDGTFGPETEHAVRALQASKHLNVDGVVGPDTWSALKIKEASTLHPVHFKHASPQASQAPTHHASAHIASVDGDSHPGGEQPAETPAHTEGAPITSRSDAVRRLQEALGVEADGTFGPETESAVKHYQQSHGLEVDGVVGPATWSALKINASMTLHPHHSSTPHSSSSGGESSDTGGGEESGVVARVIAAADEIATRPYVYGGGHGSFQSYGYDCSGSVSYALHGGGLLSSPEDSSELEGYGEPGPGRYITIYANAEHAWMTINGRRFDTVAQAESGSRWSDSMASTGGYVVRHPPGL